MRHDTEAHRLTSVAGLGPHGEFPAPADQLHVSAGNMEQARASAFRVVVVLHSTTSDWSRQQLAGITSSLRGFGASVADVIDCDFRVDRQVAALEELAASRPDGVISIPLDNLRTADAHRKLADAGVRLVLMDNAPVGMLARRHYISVVSGDNFGLGQVAAELLSTHVPLDGTIGIVGFGRDFYVTTEREIAFRKWVSERRPDATIRAAQFAEPVAAGDVAMRLLHGTPAIDGLFVVWDVPTMHVVRALRAARMTVPITTIDLGNDVAIELGLGGLVKGVGAQQPYDLGIAEATAMIMALVEEEPPPWIVIPALSVNRANVRESYETVWHAPAPPSLLRALDAAPGDDPAPDDGEAAP
jgi:ribose transport system substrate-binding protein